MQFKNLILLAFLMITGMTFSQTHLYEHPNFDELTKNHQVLAIVPFNTSITLRPKQMKDISPEQLNRMEEDEGLSIQSAMYSWFLKRKKRGKFDLTMQNPATTNAKLKKAGVNYKNFDMYTPAEIAKILEVDAVFSGSFETDKPMSEGASVALGVLVGFWGTTNKAVINLNIYNGIDGELLVNYNKAVRGSLGSSTEDLINKLMRKASRRVDYPKK